MATLNVDNITNSAGSGAPTATNGVVLGNASAGATTLNWYQEGSVSTTFTMNGSGGTTSAVTVKYARVGSLVTLYIPYGVATTSGTGSTKLISNTAIDSWARPASGKSPGFAVGIIEGGTKLSALGVITIGDSGLIYIAKTSALTAWANGGGGNGIDTLTDAATCSVSYIVT